MGKIGAESGVSAKSATKMESENLARNTGFDVPTSLLPRSENSCTKEDDQYSQ